MGQLGSGRKHGACQRAGRRWPRLALGRDRREAAAGAMGAAHHRLHRGAARSDRRPRSLARARASDAGELDRALGRCARPVRDRRPGRADRDLHDPAGHALRGLVPRLVAEPQAGPASGRGRYRPCRFYRRMQPHGHQRSGHRDRREARLRDRARSGAPVRSEPAGPGLGRQFRADGIRHRRHLRLPGA